MGASKRTVVEVAALAPLDAKTARVLGGGEHWVPKIVCRPNYVREEEGTLPTRPVPPDLEDLTGRRIGRFVVKGLGLKRPGDGKAVWVVRCDCGAYEHRTSRTLKKGDTGRTMCSHCDYLAELKAGRVPNRGPFNKDQPPP